MDNHLKKYAILILLASLSASCSMNRSDSSSELAFDNTEESLEWLDEAKFGMFVHWGLYSIPAGEWKGLEVPYISEWIMKRARIPATEYAELARDFNPTGFNAEEWVKVAKDAGMKYIIVTAKHHDGFAMFDSRVSDYDIVDRTPYGKDPMKELAEACHKNGLKLGFYYSNDQDWYEPDGTGNDWDYDPAEKDFQLYLDEKVKPQVRELLSNYGPLAIIWFDTPMAIQPEQSKELVDLVHSIQPACLVSNRVGHGMGDYKGFGDNQVPGGIEEGVWETCGTTNHSWAFKRSDHAWKSSKLLTQLLTNIVSKGGVYLLNVGPDARGVIPSEAIGNLKEVGDWLKRNGESVYGAEPSINNQEFDWGTMTRKGGRLFLQIHRMPEEGIELKGFKAKVTGAHLLSDMQTHIKFHQNEGTLTLETGEGLSAIDPFIPVIVLETEGTLEVDNTLTNKSNGIISLPAYLAEQLLSEDSQLKAEGDVLRFLPKNLQDQLKWDFYTEMTGDYKIILVVANHHWNGFVPGNEVMCRFEGENFSTDVTDSYRLENLNTLTWQDSPVEIGSISISEKGAHSLEFKPLKVSPKGLRVRIIELVPEDLDYKEVHHYKIRTPNTPLVDEFAQFNTELEKIK